MQTLRAFEAAGRLQSYSRAAEELGLTHGAVSHRVRELEATTGAKLFDRRGNTMVPTIEANRLLAQVRHALALLRAAFPDEGKNTDCRSLTISVVPSFAARWLVPQLALFREAHPNVDLKLHTTTELVRLDADGPYVTIRYGPGGWPGVATRHLASEVLFPVCSPEYRNRLALLEPCDLGRSKLLRHAWQPWATWLQSSAPQVSEPTSGPTYEDSNLLLEAASAGEGVALARGLLALNDLRSGRLVRPFEDPVADPYGYYLTWLPERSTSGARQLFENWLAPIIQSDAQEISSFSRIERRRDPN